MQVPQDPNVEAKENPKSVLQSWVGTILYCAFCFPLFLFSVFRIRDVMFVAISGFFALWGVVYLVLTVRATLGQRKFGDVRLLLEHPAPSVGGRLTGSVSLPAAAADAKQVTARLTCYELALDDKGHRAETPSWAQERKFPIQGGAGGMVARIAMDIPEGREPTWMPTGPIPMHPDGADGGRRFWKWDLQVTAELPGLDLDRSFPVVVQPAQSGTAARAIPPASAPPSAPQPMAGLPGTVETALAPDHSSTLVLVAVNLVPVAGVVLWHWQVRDIVFLYWIENLVIGAFNVLRIAFADPDQSEQKAKGLELTAGQMLAGKATVASFFLVHYGGFCYGHGEFLASLFHDANQPGAGIGAVAAGLLRETGAKIALFAIFASHAYSFFRNYLGRGEFRGVNLVALMMRPYKRIFVTHIFIILGGFMLMAAKSQLLALILFIGLKIGIDAHMHRRERAALAPAGRG